MVKKGLCVLLLALSVCISKPAQAQDQNVAIRNWLRSMGQLWLRAKPDDRAILFRKVWHHRALNPETIQKAAKTLERRERRGALRDFFSVLAAPVEEQDVLEENSDLSLAELLSRSKNGDALIQAKRYSQFLKALDKEKGSQSKALKRLSKTHKRHPWLQDQKLFVKGERRWLAMKKIFEAVPKPIGMATLKRCHFTDSDGNSGNVTRTGWLCPSKVVKFACYTDDMTMHKYDSPPTFVTLSFETDVFLTLGTTIKAPIKGDFDFMKRGPSLPTRTLVMAYYAETLGRRSLALRLFQYAERAFKTLKLKGTLKELARGEICESLWRDCASYLINGQWSRALSIAEKVKKSLKGAYYYDSCANIVPGLRTMVGEKRPPAGDDVKSRLKRAVYDLRNTRSEQWGMPGGIQISERGAMGTFMDIGWEAIPTLIDLIDDPRPTRVHSRWRAWTPPFIYDYGSLAESALARVIGVDFGKLIDWEVKPGEGKGLKERAKIWWKKNEGLGQVAYSLKIIESKPLKDCAAMLDKILKTKESRTKVGPALCKILKKTINADDRRIWLRGLARYPELGLKPVLKSELQHSNLMNAVLAAELLQKHYKDTSARAVIEKRLEDCSKAKKVDDYDVDLAFQYLRQVGSTRILDLAEKIAKALSTTDSAVFKVLKEENDSPQSRRIFLLLMRRPRTEESSTTGFSDGRSYRNYVTKDEATVFLAERLGMDEKDVFPCPACKGEDARDKRIEEIIKKYKLE